MRAHPQGISEYELLNLLREQHPAFQTDRADPLSLFRQHFLLFHILYRLQADLFSHQAALLELSPLLIVLRDYQAGPTDQLNLSDPLRNYYLDLNHLAKTGAEDVAALLNQFWRGSARADQRRSALDILGLCDPVADSEIRRRYRELVMRHHPDRGGETAQLQVLNAALATLLPAKKLAEQ